MTGNVDGRGLRDGLEKQLLALLKGGQAHAGFEAAVADMPVELRGEAPAGLPYSPWQLVEHLRIAQRDILNFSAPPTGGYHSDDVAGGLLAEVCRTTKRGGLGAKPSGDSKRS